MIDIQGRRELGEEQGTSRIWAHTDSGSVTLLWQDSVGGLEIEDPVSGQFIEVTNPQPAVLVNLGDAVERFEGGREHRDGPVLLVGVVAVEL